jgi:hypothetical protein
MDLLEHALGQGAETVVRADDAKWRNRLFAPRTLCAMHGVASLSRDGHSGRAVKPGSRIRNAVPRHPMRGNDVVAH